jgi:hypothetical protein
MSPNLVYKRKKKFDFAQSFRGVTFFDSFETPISVIKISVPVDAV